MRNISKWSVYKAIGAVVCAVIFITLALLVHRGEAIGIDTAAIKLAADIRSPFLTAFFYACTSMVHPIVLAVVAAALLIIFRKGKYRVALFVNLLISVLISMALKSRFMRLRPPAELMLVPEKGFSFPSAHTMTALSFYGFIVFLIKNSHKSKNKKITVTVLCALIIALVGMSRVYLGVHYASDVIAGFSAGSLYLIFFTSITRRYLESDIVMPNCGPSGEERGRLISSIKNAVNGIREGFATEKNILIHLSATILVAVFGVALDISVWEWCVCISLCGAVISAELFNTAIEALVDFISPQYNPKARIIKDVAAGAVLVTACAAACVGAIIFLPKLIAILM